MERVLEVIFDYACPYCYKAHAYLKELRKAYPELQVRFVPCEAHPRPEHYGMHSDLCVMGMFYCQEHDIDVWQYHDLIYKAFFVDKKDVESLDELSEYVSELVDVCDFKKALEEGIYQRKVSQNNRYAWEQLDLPAVPSFVLNDRVLYAEPDVGVTRQQLLTFLGY